MIVTHTEAKTKTCRIGQIAQMCGGIMVVTASNVTSADQKAFDKLGTCIASECMFWEWKEKQVFWAEESLGFCSLGR